MKRTPLERYLGLPEEPEVLPPLPRPPPSWVKGERMDEILRILLVRPEIYEAHPRAALGLQLLGCVARGDTFHVHIESPEEMAFYALLLNWFSRDHWIFSVIKLSSPP